MINNPHRVTENPLEKILAVLDARKRIKPLPGKHNNPDGSWSQEKYEYILQSAMEHDHCRHLLDQIDHGTIGEDGVRTGMRWKDDG